MSYNDLTSKGYSADQYGRHKQFVGERIMGYGLVRRYAYEIAVLVTHAARESNTPVVHVTGNSYVPPLRSFAGAELVWSADNGAHSADEFAGPALYEFLTCELKRLLDEANVYLDSPPDDNALYVVDLNRWRWAGDWDHDADNLNDDFELIEGTA
ncbi:MAG TPA: hypothetical protein VGG75_13705 [Trebonia sp.]